MSPDPQTSEKAGHVCGMVYLVGAGPGDPGWITVRGMELLRLADVVVFDALANPRLLAEARSDARLIDAGKRAKDHTLTQDQTNQLLADLAKQGLQVVRLKGGDPYLFGRGAEEAAFLARQGVASEVVPGVTSGIAAPMAAGIPVTHRSIASTVTFITGHEKPGKDSSGIDYASLAGLAKVGGTLCFYMGVGRIGAIADQLAEHGLDRATPVAVIQWGGTPRQKSVRSTLANAAADITKAGVGAPAMIVVGQVAGIDEPGLDFFTRRRLFGQRVLVMRTRHQASDLSQQLTLLGADVLEAPTIELTEPDAEEWKAIDEALTHLDRFDWLVLTSVNGVDALARRLDKLGLDARALRGLKLAAIGEATDVAMRRRLGVKADLIPTQFVAESLAADLIAKQGVAGKRFLLLRADIARPALPRELKAAGASVTELSIYLTKRAAALPENVVEALEKGDLDWITFTSSSTARNLVDLLGDRKALLTKVKLASIGPITSQTMRKLGLKVDAEAKVHTIPGLVAAIG